LFTVGNFLYGRYLTAWVLLGVCIVAGLVLITVIRKLWANNTEVPATAAAGDQGRR
jgi:hypothetical protein